MKHKVLGLYIWEVSLLIALCITLCTGVLATSAQRNISDEVIRLHVIAQSNSESDQAVKLRVRDAVLDLMSPVMKDIDKREDAKSVIEAEIPSIEKTANDVLLKNGFNIKATAELRNETYPTRNYSGFSLPCGEYLSLIVTLGEGNGRNWWCVVFPPLCTATGVNDLSVTTLSDGTKNIIITDDNEPQVKFRIIEFYNKLKHRIS